MAQVNYARCLANTLVEEGGYVNHPQDPGGPTMRGVIQKVYDQYRSDHRLARQSVKFITEGELQAIYRTGYWDPIKGDRWPKGPDQIAFDIAVNSGPGRVRPLMAKALSTPASTSIDTLVKYADGANDRIALCKKACANRASFYRSLGTYKTFGKGWMRRNARIEAISIKMCTEDERLSQKETKDLIKKEENSARKKAQRNKKAAVTTGGGGAVAGGGTASQVETFDWTSFLIIGFLVVGVALAMAVFIYNWQNNLQRMRAFAALASDLLETGLTAVFTKLQGGDDNGQTDRTTV